MSPINLEIIKQFQNIFQFRKEADQESIDLFLNEETIIEYSGITWLYECIVDNLCLIGFQDNVIYAIDSEGFLVGVCTGLENIPYEILRIKSSYTTNEIVQEVFDKHIDYALDFHKYEQWCQENNIILDQNNEYHDSNGNLFTDYFDKY